MSYESLTGIIEGNSNQFRKSNSQTINNNSSNKYEILENELISLNKDNKEKDKLIEQLKNELNHKEEEKIKLGQEITKLKMEMKNKDIENKRLKIDLKVKIDENIENNKRIKIIVQSSDSVINNEIESFENDKFVTIEEKLYVQFENYRNSNNLFLANGEQVFRFKTLKEQNINDWQVIIMNVFD